MVSTAERQNLTGRTAITSWKKNQKMFRGMSKHLQNQSKSTHHIDHSVKEAMGGMNVQVALVNSTWLAFSPNACDIRLKMTEVCIKEIKGNIWVFDTF